MVESDNIAYNRLVQLAGYKELNTDILSKHRNMFKSGIHRPYAKTEWKALTGLDHFLKSPKIVLKQGKHRIVLPKTSYKRLGN